jgi:hypothetical protein
MRKMPQFCAVKCHTAQNSSSVRTSASSCERGPCSVAYTTPAASSTGTT